MIAIDAPGLILKKLKTAPAPVWIPHPKGARTERSYAASTFTSDFSVLAPLGRSEEHTSELQSLMRHSSADFRLKKNEMILVTTHNGSLLNNKHPYAHLVTTQSHIN